jgi:hypothetical protein
MSLLDPNTFHRLVSKKLAFILLNLAAVLAFLYSDQMHLDIDSILGCFIALVILNGAALISARKYPDWK